MKKLLIIAVLLILGLGIKPVFANDCSHNDVNNFSLDSCLLSAKTTVQDLEEHSKFAIAHASAQGDTPITQNSQKGKAGNYHTIEIILSFLAFQLAGFILVKYKKLSIINWRKINNYLLLISFVVVFLTSVLLLAELESWITLKAIGKMRAAHIIWGLVMMLFALEHTIRRWRFFKI